MISKLLQSVALGLILFASSIAAKDQISSPIVSEAMDVHVSDTDQKEILLLRDDLNAGQNSINQSSTEKQAFEAAYPETTCDPFPLPTEPIGPFTRIESERGGHEFYWTSWRYPCNEEFSWVVFTIEPKTSQDRPFICSVQIMIIQDGLEESNLKLCADPIDDHCDSKCGDVIVKSSYALTEFGSLTSDRIDLNKGFYLDWDLFTSVINGDIPAYDPSQYGFGGGPQSNISSGHSGAWFNRDQDGHGLNVATLDATRTLIYWYVYHTDGTPMFLTTVGTNDGNSTSGTTYYNAGMKFGEFNPNDREQTVWGTSTVTFHDCNNATLEYSANDPAYGSGTIPMERLASVSDLICSD